MKKDEMGGGKVKNAYKILGWKREGPEPAWKTYAYTGK